MAGNPGEAETRVESGAKGARTRKEREAGQQMLGSLVVKEVR
jgi:hypothetical protein